MAGTTIKRHATFEKVANITIGGVAVDLSFYNGFVCKIRDRPKLDHVDPLGFVDGGVITLAAATIAGQSSSLKLTLSATDTAKLQSTEAATEGQLPQLDILMVETATSNVLISDKITVAVLETVSYA